MVYIDNTKWVMSSMFK